MGWELARWNGVLEVQLAAYALHQQLNGCEAFRVVMGRSQNHSRATAALGSQLQPARQAIVQIIQRNQHNRHARTSQRLVRRPKCVLLTRGSNDDKPIQQGPMLLQSRGIEIVRCVNQNDGARFQLVFQ